jgi:anti-repressor protein
MNNFSIIENGIIPVYLSDKGTRLVNMRELHAWLGVETRFNDWITRRIMQYGFIENEDYLLLKNEYGENTAFQAKDYIFKLEPAKEIALVENNEKGRELRRYFIQVEEKYRLQVKQDSYMISDPIERARRWIQEQEQKKVLESKVKELTPAAEFGNAVSNNAGGLLIRDYVKVLENDGVKIGQDKFFSWLHINNYI